MPPEISNDFERDVRDMSKTFQRSNKRSSWKIAKDLPTSFFYAAKGLGYALLNINWELSLISFDKLPVVKPV